MTGADLAEWTAFEQVCGPVLIHERLDAVQAMLSYVVAKVGGAKDVSSPQEFLPHWDGVQARAEADERIVRTLTGMKEESSQP